MDPLDPLHGPPVKNLWCSYILQCVSRILIRKTRLKFVMVVWFKAQTNFHYYPSYLKNDTGFKSGPKN